MAEIHIVSLVPELELAILPARHELTSQHAMCVSCIRHFLTSNTGAYGWGLNSNTSDGDSSQSSQSLSVLVACQ